MNLYDENSYESDQPEWKVYFSGNFWGHHEKRERPGKELLIEKEFTWDNERVRIPSVYICSAGLVVDYCIAVEEERIRAFFDKWYDPAAGDPVLYLTDEECENLNRENPMNLSFRSHVRLNGRELLDGHSCSCSWIPCMPEGMDSDEDAVRILEHYHCDRSFGWIFIRAAFSWVTRRKPAIRELCFRLEREPVIFGGPHFYMDQPKQTIEIAHPVTGQTYTITVLSCSSETLLHNSFQDSSYEYPSRFRQVTYRISPEPSQGAITIRDCSNGDRPVPKRMASADGADGPISASSAAGVAVIGGADGPTAVFLAGTSNTEEERIALSALYFELPDRIEWRALFHEKTVEDIETAVKISV